jgi:Tol biopolymer transport system component
MRHRWTSPLSFLLGLVLLTGLIVGPLDRSPTATAASDSRLIAYLDRANDVWVSQADWSGASRLTAGGGFGSVVWSNDGTRIAATGPTEGVASVFILSPEPGYGARSLGAGRAPAWSPDSARLAYIDGGVVHVFGRDGNFLRSIPATADALEWSPDGRRIGFTRIVDDPYGTGCAIREIGWIDANTGSISVAGRTIGRFTWAGDGDRLLYVSATDGAVRSISTSQQTIRLLSTRTANPCHGPFMVTPDGTRLIFLDHRDSARDLVAIDLANNQQRVYPNLPISFPDATLPEGYVNVDEQSRFVTISRSYPTDVTRLDLVSGQIQNLIVNDWRQVVDVSPDGRYVALLHVPAGLPLQMTIRDTQGGTPVMREDVGWLAWQPSPLNPAAAYEWGRTWERQDRPVASGMVERTWIWGPAPFAHVVESYDNAPDGKRATRYYDKSRMEITTPFGNRSDDWYVTNGLLVRELISGAMQVGDARFIQRAPSNIPVAGDPNDLFGPTYATMQPLLSAPPTPVGQDIRATLNRAGSVGSGGPGGVTAAHFVPQTNHTVASVFWDYLNSSGPVWVDGGEVTGRLFEPTFFVTGYPITEAYWAQSTVGGQQRQVLIQCFERRCLTFTPDNPDGWQVEMGNVGLHYYAWRHDQ